jgi:phytoene dehydrogenase-like protein
MDNQNSASLHVDVAVVGAGLAGLAAAQLVQRAGRSVVVLDGQAPGGRARTDERRGFRFNRGPHALYRGGCAEEVLGRLGVRPPGRPPGSPAYGLLGDRMAPLPSDASSLVRNPLLSWRAKVGLARLLRRLPKLRPADLAEVTFSSWLGDQGLPRDAEVFVEMLARVASYSNAPDIVSADVIVNQIQMALGSGVRYLDGGWQRMVEALGTGLDVRPRAATRLGRDGGDVMIECGDDAAVVAKAVIVAAGTPAAVSTFLGCGPFDVGPPIEAACLDLGVSGTVDPPLLLGLDTPLYLSMHSPPADLAPRDHSVVHVARYLAPGEQTDPHSQREELEKHAARAGITADRVVEHRYLHRMTVAGALPTADRGGMSGRPTIRDSGVAAVFLAGDWVGRRGHLLDAALASADEAAAAAVTLVTA